MNMKWTEHEVLFLKDNYIEMKNNVDKLCKLLNRTNNSIQNKAFRLGLKLKVKNWLEDEELVLVKKFMDGMPLKDIAELLHRSYNAINARIGVLGLKRELINYNKDFFNINNWSKELAWVAGLIMSDGHVGVHRGRYRVRLKMSDFDVINKVKNITNFTGNINNERGTNKRLFSICFGYKYAWEFFDKLGFKRDKSYTAKWPIGLPNEYISHFVRGMFDGDGSIRYAKNFYPVSYICGTESLIRDIKNVINIDNYIWKYNNNITYGIQFSGVRAHKFLSYIYIDSNENIRMDRKYSIYKKTLKWKPSKYILEI